MSNRENPSLSATSWAPAKLILFGEHSVGYGEPALGLALSRGISVQVRAGTGRVSVALPPGAAPPRPGGPTPEILIEATLGERRRQLDVEVELEVPPQGGLGTSAALAVALIRARRALDAEVEPESIEALLREAMQIEHLAHGRSSGLDPALVLHGPSGPVWFEPGPSNPKIEILPALPPVELIIGMSVPHGGTAGSVMRVAALADAQARLHEKTMSYLGELTKCARSCLVDGDRERFGLAMNLAHGVLSGLGLVGPEVAALVDAARGLGALGVKMTGAGGAGGALFALAPNAEIAEAVSKRWTAAGAFVLRQTFGSG